MFSKAKILLIITSLLIIVGLKGATVANAQDYDQEVTIYGMEVPDTASINHTDISIPADLPQSTRVEYENDYSNSISCSGNSALASSDGTIKPKIEYWVWDSRGSSAHTIDESEVLSGGAYDYTRIYFGDSVVTLKQGNKVKRILVHVVDYAEVYGKKVIADYIAANLSEAQRASMSDYNLLATITQFAAQYDFYEDPYLEYGQYDLIRFGLGFNNATVELILNLCDQLGIKAWKRNCGSDGSANGGAGYSVYYDVMVQLNGKYYQIDVANSPKNEGANYRSYHVTERSSLFNYKQLSYDETRYEITQYDGNDFTEDIVVPSSIDGRQMYRIAYKAFSDSKITGVIIPEGIKEICSNAFFSCKSLQSVTIPKSMQTISAYAFNNCTALTDFRINNNEKYTVIEQALYQKDGQNLLLASCPAAASIAIPQNVTEILSCAFKGNSNLEKITVPANVKKIGGDAFRNCSKLSDVILSRGGVTELRANCFSECRSLSVMRIPDTVTTIGSRVFYDDPALQHVFFYGDAPANMNDDIFEDDKLIVHFPGSNSTWTGTNKAQYKASSIEWKSWSPAQTKDLRTGTSIMLSQDTYTYNATLRTPDVTVRWNGMTLTKDVDYCVTYRSNREAGQATVMISGIAAYEGNATTTFTIQKGTRNVHGYVSNFGRVEEGGENVIYDLSPFGGYEYYTFRSQDTSIATVDENGVVRGVKHGTTKIEIILAEDNSYAESIGTVNVEVIHSSEFEVVDGVVTDNKLQIRCKGCGEIYTKTVPSSMELKWYDVTNLTTEVPESTDEPLSSYPVGTTLWVNKLPQYSYELRDLEVLVDRPRVADVSDGEDVEEKKLYLKADGKIKVTVRLKYNPSVSETFEITVGTGIEAPEPVETPTPSPTPGTAGDTTGNGTAGKGKTGNGTVGQGTTGNGTTGNGTTGNNGAENNGSTTVDRYIKIYDKKTGITLQIKNGDRKHCVLVSVKAKRMKKNFAVPNKLKIGKKTYVITTIGKKAFKNNKKLVKIKLGKKINRIEKEAFAGCKKLKSIQVGAKKIAFLGKNAIKGVPKKATKVLRSKLQKK